MVEIEEIEESESGSVERLKDAEEVESLLSSVTRETVKMELTALAKRLRKDSQALKRLESSQNSMKDSFEKLSTREEKVIVEEVKTKKSQEGSSTITPPAKQGPTSSASKPPVTLSSAKYTPINSFAFDSGKYNSSFVTIYVSLE